MSSKSLVLHGSSGSGERSSSFSLRKLNLADRIRFALRACIVSKSSSVGATLEEKPNEFH